MLSACPVLIEIGCGSHATRVDLRDGAVRVGGAEADEICIAGLPAGLLTLRIEGERLTVTSTEPTTIGKSAFPSHLPRLLVPGERVRLRQQVTVMQVPQPRRDKGTATVMRDLIEGTCAAEQTRAATLTVLTGADSGNVVPLAFEQLLLGRGDDCQVQVRDTAVSRRHARLTLRAGRAAVEDLHTANGTWVNGKRVRRRAPLVPGDVIELGQTLLRYDAPHIESPPSPESAVVDPSLVEPPRRPASRADPRWLLATFVGGAAALLVGAAAALAALV